MSKLQTSHWLRAAGIGAFFACLGFSLALATSESRGLGGATVRVASSGITTSYTRPPVSFVTASDLGAVVAGTQFTRQLIAHFGYKPHHFFYGDKALDGVTLSDSGLLSGAVAGGLNTFNAYVADEITGVNFVSQGNLKTFTVNAIDSQQVPTDELHFVNAPTLPVAVANEPYSFTLHANGGVPPYVFQLLDNPDFLALPDGLALNPGEGLIMGKPIMPTPTGQPAAFRILLTDTRGVVFTPVIQTFFLTVLPGTISTEFVATSGSFALKFGKDSLDSLSLSVVLNKTDLGRAGVRQASDLKGVDFSMDFGGVVLPPPLTEEITQPSGTGTTTTFGPPQFDATFDKNGTIRFPNVMGGFPRKKGETQGYSIKLNPASGVLNVKFDHIFLIRALGADFKAFGQPRGTDQNAGPVIPVRILIGAPATAAHTAALATTTTTATTTATTTPSVTGTTTVSFDKTDAMKFTYRRRGDKAKGVAGRGSTLAPGGMFLVTKVQGVERQVDSFRDRLYLRVTGFLRQVGGQSIEFGNNDQVSLMFGQVVVGSFPASNLTRDSKGRLVFVNQDGSAAPLLNFVIDNKKGTFLFDTHGLKDVNGLDPRQLFGLDILPSGLPFYMPVTLNITGPDPATAFDAQSSATVFRKGNKLLNK